MLTDSLTADDFGPLDLSLGNMAGTAADNRGLDESDFLNPSALSDPEGKAIKTLSCQNESRNALVNISPLETHVLPQAIVFHSDRWKMSGYTYSCIEIVLQNGVLFPLCMHAIGVVLQVNGLSFETSGMPCTKIFTMSSFLNMCIARIIIFSFF